MTCALGMRCSIQLSYEGVWVVFRGLSLRCCSWRWKIVCAGDLDAATFSEKVSGKADRRTGEFYSVVFDREH